MDRSKCYRVQLMDISLANKLNDPEKNFYIRNNELYNDYCSNIMSNK